MPKRTNDFQKLVYLFKQQLAGRATVTESKELDDRVTGAKVEVDICIETQVGGDNVIIAVECTKRGRKATVGWVNEMLAKHESLPTHLLVLASASGFVKNASAKAYSRGAKLIYLKDVSEANIRSIMGEIRSVSVSVFQLTKDDVLLRLSAVGKHPQVVIRPTHDYSVYASDGNRVGTVNTLCEELRDSSEFLKGVDRQGVNEKTDFAVEWQPLRDGQPLSLQTDDGRFRQIDRIRLIGSFESRITNLKVWNQSLDNVQIAWAEGKAPFFNESIVVLRTTDSSGVEQVSGTIGQILLAPKKVNEKAQTIGE